MYKSYLELAAYFLKSDDRWLSDFFYEKSLSVAHTYPQLDPKLAAEAYLNVGLAYERRSSTTDPYLQRKPVLVLVL